MIELSVLTAAAVLLTVLPAQQGFSAVTANKAGSQPAHRNVSCAPVVPSAASPVVAGASAIIMDAATGQILWAKNPHTRRPMASTTKVMTVFLALENGNLDDPVTAPKGIETIPECSLHLVPGENLPLRSLIYGAMVRSGNDAASLIARHVGGTQEEFVRMMNDRAREMGLEDTQFKNASGLNARGHYSSAYDLAVIAREAVKLKEFNDYCGVKRVAIERDKSKDRLLINQARFISTYPGADGIKTGYTRQAGRCFIGSATRNGWRLITVVLKSPNAGSDTQNMMDWAFKHFERKPLARAGTVMGSVEVSGGSPDRVNAVARDDLFACLPRGAKKPAIRSEYFSVAPPAKKGDVIGIAVAQAGGREISRVDLVAGSDVEQAPPAQLGFTALTIGIPLMYFSFRRMSAVPADTISEAGSSQHQPSPN